MKHETISLAIFNSNKLYKELLHHQIEHTHYEVFYSSTDINELLSYFIKRPAHILLVDGKYLTMPVLECLPLFCGYASFPVSVLFYNSFNNQQLTSKIKNKFNERIYYCDSSMSAIYDSLDSIIARYQCRKPKETIYQKILLPASHPFFNISINRISLEILRMLSEGKSCHEIALLTGFKPFTIETYVKNMREKTGSKNVAHLVSRAKEWHLI